MNEVCTDCGGIENCSYDCPCRECNEMQEIAKDREFDEKIALGYFV